LEKNSALNLRSNTHRFTLRVSLFFTFILADKCLLNYVVFANNIQSKVRCQSHCDMEALPMMASDIDRDETPLAAH
jgi:hypothetical protein